MDPVVRFWFRLLVPVIFLIVSLKVLIAIGTDHPFGSLMNIITPMYDGAVLTLWWQGKFRRPSRMAQQQE